MPSDDHPLALKKLWQLQQLQPRITVRAFGPGHHFLSEEHPARVVDMVVEAIHATDARP